MMRLPAGNASRDVVDAFVIAFTYTSLTDITNVTPTLGEDLEKDICFKVMLTDVLNCRIKWGPL